mgnify:CR=1 FL=1
MPERQIAEAEANERGECAGENVIAILFVIECGENLLDRERQHIRHCKPAMFYREHFGAESFALADGAEELHIGQELHLDRLVAFAAARLQGTA